MSYQPGDVKLEGDDKYTTCYDARIDDDNEHQRGKSPVAYLDHSCDQWVIGDRRNVESMIADLRAILARMP